MAVICRGFMPVQMTKKSVKPPAFRRSSTTTSTAFLSCTACTAPSTLFGSFGAAFLRVVATFLDALVFAMQAVYRSIEMVFLDMPRDGRWHQLVDRSAARQALPDHGRGHVARVRVDEENPRRAVTCDGFARDGGHSRPQLRCTLRRLVDAHPGPRDDDEMREVQEPEIPAPCGNSCKRVAAKNEKKLRRPPAGSVERPERVLGVRPSLSHELHVGHGAI